MTDGAVPKTYHAFDGNWRAIDGHVIQEVLVSIHVNGQELATIAATPIQLDWLAVGFLANEGFIAATSEVRAVHVCPSGLCVDVWLTHEIEPPRKPILTSGCGGGVTFDDLTKTQAPLDSDSSLPAERLWDLMDQLKGVAHLYHLTRGVHTSALFQGTTMVSSAEDVGRHNTLDKVRGDCLLRGLDTRGGILLSTGRISSEMLNKAAKMGCPVVASRTSPTSLSVNLARAWNITLVGYLRRGKMLVYANGWRLGLDEAENT
jgi:FdhD protein